MLQLPGFCRLGSCEMVLLWLSGGAKHRLLFWGGARRSPESVTPFWLQLCQDPLSGTKLLSGIVLWCSRCGEFNLGNTGTAESFVLRDDGWARFQMQRTLTFRPEHLSHSVLEGSVLLHFSVQRTGKQVEVSNNYTSGYWWKSLKERTLR